MKRESRWFRAASFVLSVVVAHFLCGGRLAEAAPSGKKPPTREEVAKTLNLPLEFLDDPSGWQDKQALAAKQRRADALERLKQFTASPRQSLQLARVASLTKTLESSNTASKLSAAAARAKLLKTTPEATKSALEKVAPGYRLAAARPHAAPVKLPTLQTKPLPKPAGAPHSTWPKQGALTPSMLELYASTAGTTATVVMPDGSQLPVDAMAMTPVRKPTQLAGLMSDWGLPLPLLGVLSPPTADDTAQTPETALSPAISALLASTPRTPLALFNAVLTRIRPELYAGSKKGADATLREAAGNDFDTASLLLSLLRASGIPSRYEYGTVSLSLPQAQSLTGARTLAAAAQLLGSVGVPTALSADGTHLLVERAWVRAWVPFSDGRYGGTTSGESLWVRLDAGLKLQDWKPAANLKSVASFDAAAFLSTPNTRSPQAVYESQLLAAARARSLCNTLDEALYSGTLTQPPLSLLPAEAPAPVVASLLTFSRPPDSLRWKVAVDMGGLATSFDLPDLEYHSLSIRYLGATPADVAALTAAGDISNVVPFQVQVVPVLRLDGIEKARGTPVFVGTQQLLTARTSVPQGSPRAFSHRLVAGGVYSLSLSGGVTTEAWAQQQRNSMAGKPFHSPEAIEAAANAVQALYSHRAQTSARRLAALTGHIVVLDAFESLAGRQLLVTEANGVPVSVRWGLYFIDANDSLTPLPRDGNTSQVENLSELFGVHGSYLESQAWEEVFSRKALSTVSIIQAARTQAVPVDTFTGGTVASLSGYSASATAEMNEALSAGWRVTAPRRPISFGGYLGSEGYILRNPDGTGSYKVSFDLNGGGSGGPDAPAVASCPTCAAANSPTGSVIDVASATWREMWTDLTLPGAGMPVSFGRVYASRADEASTLGPRWMHNFGIFLRTEANGDVTWVQQDLRLARFTLTSPGVFTPPPGYFQQLTTRTTGGWRLREKDGFFRDFNAAGQLESMSDTSGNTVSLVYVNGQLTEVRDTTGQLALSFSYTDGFLTDVGDRAGRHARFSYSGGNLTGFTDAAGGTESYGYDNAHHLTSYTGLRGFTRFNFYDAQGRWTGGRDALGAENRLLHDAIGRRATLFDKLGAPTLFEWGPSGELLATTDAVGNETHVVRNADFLPTTHVDGRGLTTAMSYDARGNLLTAQHPDGRVDAFTYDATFNRMLSQASTGLPRVSMTYDGAGRLLTRTDGIGTTAYGYDGRGQINTVTAPGNAIQRFGYDANGNLNTVNDATNRTNTMTYDAAGHVVSTADSLGLGRTMVVDALGRLSSMTDELHHTTVFTHDAAGLRLTTTDANGGLSTATYDALGRTIATRDASGAIRKTEYDAEGRVLATENALGKRSFNSYDAAGRLVAHTDEAGFTNTVGYCADVGQACASVDALGHTQLAEFDEVGRTKSMTDELGRPTTMTYDSGGRLKLQAGPLQVPTEYTYDSTGFVFSMTSPVMTVFYQYDVRGNRTAVIASGAQAGNETTSYTYDAANRLLTERNPLNQVTTFTYDAVGNRATKLDAKGQLTTYAYDDERRLTDVSFADGTAYAFRFDSLGRRVSEASSTHARTLQYDAVGRVSLVNDGQTGATIESAYDGEGRRTLVREGGVERRIEYDVRGFVKRLALGSSGFINVTHDALGRRTAVTRPNGVRSDWLFDDASQLVSVMHTKGGVVIDGFTYAYDAHGLRTRKTRFDGTFEVYSYDAADRLTRVDDEAGKSSQYILDGLGNRTALNVAQPGIASLSTTSNSNAFNQLTGSSRSGGGLPNLATAYAYDANGNLTSETAGSASTAYAWDADNRLRQVTQQALVSSYQYDARGLRTRKVEGTAETRFLLDGQSVLAEYDSANVATRRYLQAEVAIDDIYAFAEGGHTYFPLPDALGSVVSITDSAGAVVRRNSYEVYGTRTSTGTGPQWAYGFTGREQDASGSRYHRDRYASAATGTWSQADRLKLKDGPNRYRWVRSSPTQLTDPSGRAAFMFIGRDGNEVARLRQMWQWDFINTSIGSSLYYSLLTMKGEILVEAVELTTQTISYSDRPIAQTVLFDGGISACASGTRAKIEFSFPLLDRHNRELRHSHFDAEILAHELGHLAYFNEIGIERVLSASTFGLSHFLEEISIASGLYASLAGRRFRNEVMDDPDGGHEDLAEDSKPVIRMHP